MFYKIARNIVLLIYKLMFSIKVSGLENIPQSGGIILSGNHRSNHDPILLAVSQKRPLSFMAKDTLLKVPIVGFVLKHANVFPVKRGSGDIGAVKKAIEILKNGGALSLFPEGTRNKTDNNLQEFKQGSALIAYKSRSLIVPCGIMGKFRLFSRITIVYGKPINPADYGEKPDLNQITADLKTAVSQILSESGAVN